MVVCCFSDQIFHCLPSPARRIVNSGARPKYVAISINIAICIQSNSMAVKETGIRDCIMIDFMFAWLYMDNVGFCVVQKEPKGLAIFFEPFIFMTPWNI